MKMIGNIMCLEKAIPIIIEEKIIYQKIINKSFIVIVHIISSHIIILLRQDYVTNIIIITSK